MSAIYNFQQKKKNKTGSMLSSILFFIVIVFLIVFIFFDTVAKYSLIQKVNKNTDYQLNIETFKTNWRDGIINLENIILIKDTKTIKIDKIFCIVSYQELFNKHFDIQVIDFYNVQVDKQTIQLEKNNDELNQIIIKNYIDIFRQNIEKLKPYLEVKNEKLKTFRLSIDKIKMNYILKKDLLNKNTINVKLKISMLDIDNIYLNSKVIFGKSDTNVLDKNITDPFVINSKVNFSLINKNKFTLQIDNNLSQSFENKIGL